jgi:hypothetical protein
MMSIRSRLSRCLLGSALCAGALGAAEAADPGVTYKCPGAVYSNTITPKEAKDKGCTVLDNAPVSVIQGFKPRPTSGPVPAASGSRVDPADQRARDSDARRILDAELKREEDRLAAMRADYNNGEPERQGNDKNFQKYQDRVADMRAAIARKESDIAALKREIAKQPQ